jgi:hypothetical protein
MLTTVVITGSSAQNLVSIVLGNLAGGFIEIAALAGLGLYIIKHFQKINRFLSKLQTCIGLFKTVK